MAPADTPVAAPTVRSSSKTLPLQSTTVLQVATVGAANRHRKSLAMSASTFARRREKSTGLVS